MDKSGKNFQNVPQKIRLGSVNRPTVMFCEGEAETLPKNRGGHCDNSPKGISINKKSLTREHQKAPNPKSLLSDHQIR